MKSFGYSIMVLLILAASFAYAQSDTTKQVPDKKRHLFRDPVDGAFDMGDFLANHSGILPVPIIVTEPAIGYGGGLGLLFFHTQKNPENKGVTPSVSGIAALGTQNKTWAGALFHSHVFGKDKVRTVTAFGKPRIHIKYYGNNNPVLAKFPIKLEMDAWFAYQKAEVRIGATNWFAGGAYIFYRTDNSIDTIPGNSLGAELINKLIKVLANTSVISMLVPMINFDSRDNLFTPTKGFYTGAQYAYSAKWLGASNTYHKIDTYFLSYVPVGRKVYSGWHFNGEYVIGEAPGYALPYIKLRGIPAMRYQSENTLLAEMEWRYQFYKRWSVLAFGGGGTAFQDFKKMKNGEWAYTLGTGIRYELARIFGLHSGVDFAWGNAEDFAFYIVVGSSLHK